MGDLVWDERLMSQEEFWRLAAPLQLRPAVRQTLAFLDCGQCGQAVLPLGTIRKPWTTTVQQIAGAVLRHQVAAHNMPLNHRRGKPHADDSRAAGGLPDSEPEPAQNGRDPVRARAHPAGRRPADKAAGRARVPGTAGGDRA